MESEDVELGADQKQPEPPDQEVHAPKQDADASGGSVLRGGGDPDCSHGEVDQVSPEDPEPDPLYFASAKAKHPFAGRFRRLFAAVFVGDWWLVPVSRPLSRPKRAQSGGLTGDE